ncbi:RpiB/LacA/LacB family sugar-phosphate isomerase [Lacrimispora sp.]|uniref:RpiB/LacA/LacB family sugar-phosphate isomerase n=1 Tax=Lacrimispora sp. TaxID=2719234 RepID=UPI00289F0DB5|nr:RpiB/LacA/LacB family sugar-phosphate isomerase [Lacrimispora sp.]
MIGLGCDHSGYELMQDVKRHLDERSLQYIDFGCYDKSAVDYPVYARKVAYAVKDGECSRGI